MAKTTSRIEIAAKDKTKSALRSVESGLGRVSKAVFSVQSAVGVLVGAAGMGTLIAQSLKTGDALGKTADKLGTTTKALAGLRLAAERTAGVSNQALDTALQRLTRRSSEAAQGTGTLAKELKLLGIDAQAFNQLSVDQQFAQLGDAMSGVTNQGDRLRIAMAAFDTEGAALEATLAGGSASLDEFATEAEKLGLAISRIDASRIEAANDSMDTLGKATQGVGLQITAALAPALQVASEKMVSLAADANFWGEATTKAIEFIVNGFSTLQETLNFASFAWEFWSKAVNRALEFVTGALANAWRMFADLAAMLPAWLGGDSEAVKALDGLATAAEAWTLKFSDAANANNEKMIEAAESTVTWAETTKSLLAEVAAAAEETGSKQVEALALVEKKQSKHVKIMAKNDKLLAAEVAKTEKAKVGALKTSTSAAMTLGNALFEDNKAIRAGLIVADTAAAITKALAIYGPTPQGFAAAAAAAATGVAQLAAAQGAQKGGGSIAPASGGGGGGGAGASSPVLDDAPAAAGPTQAVNISLTGGLYSRDDIRELIRNINQEIGDGAELVAA